tara:strand:- start:1376 stop:1828 length:453 start_codon:yes stop_codon:yes gene_type:complete
MELKFEVSTRVGRPVHQVFEAVVDPAKLSRYFTTGGAVGRLEAGATVQWDFADFPGAFPVEVIEVVQDQRIVLRWAGAEGLEDGRTTVTLTFAPLDDGSRTLVTIAEAAWTPTPAGLKASYGNCAGWTQMLSALKAWVEYDINLREGTYR